MFITFIKRIGIEYVFNFDDELPNSFLGKEEVGGSNPLIGSSPKGFHFGKPFLFLLLCVPLQGKTIRSMLEGVKNVANKHKRIHNYR